MGLDVSIYNKNSDNNGYFSTNWSVVHALSKILGKEPTKLNNKKTKVTKEQFAQLLVLLKEKVNNSYLSFGDLSYSLEYLGKIQEVEYDIEEIIALTKVFDSYNVEDKIEILISY